MFAPDDEPLMLQLKEARASVLEPYVGRSIYENNGRRVVAGQRIAQSASDLFLGWTEIDGKHFYVRQLRDTKVKPEPELWDADHAKEAAQVMGITLARSHARTGDAAIIRGYLGKVESFDDSLASFAAEYADQVEADHGALVRAVGAGKIRAITDASGDT
jgi:hypothetical protein